LLRRAPPVHRTTL